MEPVRPKPTLEDSVCDCLFREPDASGLLLIHGRKTINLDCLGASQN